MKTLLIIDDEQLIRKGIVARITKMKVDFQKLLEAPSAKVGLQMLQEHAVDACIVDINMPEVDGLTFIAEAKIIAPEVQFIILSGYSEFEYARKAIELGAAAYLLKPVSSKELSDTLTKISKTISLNLAGTPRAEDTTAQFAANELNQILLRRPTPSGVQPHYPHLASMLDFEQNPYYYVAILRAKCEHHLSNTAVSDVFQAHCGKATTCFAEDYSHSARYWITFAGQHALQLKDEVFHVLSATVRALTKKFDAHVTVGVSAISEQLNPDNAMTAKEALNQTLLTGQELVSFYEDLHFSKAHPPVTQMQTLYDLLEQGNYDKFLVVFDDMFSHSNAERMGVSYIALMLSNVSTMMTSALRLDSERGRALGRQLSRILEDASDFPEALKRCQEVLKACFDAHFDAPKDTQSKLAHCLHYIQTHLDENLSVNELAEAYQMNANYFSTLFRKETGKSPITYITAMKMEHAKTLLMNKQFSVAEVARKVGYEDSQYFSAYSKKPQG